MLKKPKPIDESKTEIVVFLSKDYSKSDSFFVDPDSTTKGDVDRIVKEKYGDKGWFYLDIWGKLKTK